MARIVNLHSWNDNRGVLTVLDKELPFAIRRAFWITSAMGRRGGHRHKHNCMALVSVGGSCEVYVNDGNKKNTFVLDNPQTLLILDPEDWHTMDKFTTDCVLLVLASHTYEKEDYIDQEYNN